MLIYHGTSEYIQTLTTKVLQIAIINDDHNKYALLALVRAVQSCLCAITVWYPGSGVVLDCIDY